MSDNDKHPKGFYLAYLERFGAANRAKGISATDIAPESYWQERREQEAMKESVRRNMEVISCKEAKAKGLARYFTGKPCKRGHIAERFIAGGCVECKPIRDGLYLAANYDKEAERKRRWREKSPEEYASWAAMITRCENPNVKEFMSHSGRGIKVCDRWKDSFADFLADMGPRPSPQHSIDRINVNGNYEKSNCRWASTKEQAENKRNTVMIEFNGRKQSVATLAREMGISRKTVHARIKKGWPAERLFDPLFSNCRAKAA
jgi:hypothetical protein